MDANAIRPAIIEALKTEFTKTVHKAVYPAISPIRPELSQAGKTVLITGGGGGLGLEIAKAFVSARAARVIIVGRRADVLAKARTELEAEAEKLSSPSVIVDTPCDIASDAEVDALWTEAGQVDVLVLNAAKFQTDVKTLADLGIAETWASFQVNVRAALYMAERFHKQRTLDGKPISSKYLLNVSTAAIHQLDPTRYPLSMQLPSYSLTKNAGTLAMQLFAEGVDPAETQIVSFHPGFLYTEVWAGYGVSKAELPFDDIALPSAFAVWAASSQAGFLHGRFVWAHWDVEELASDEIRERINADHMLLRLGHIGI